MLVVVVAVSLENWPKPDDLDDPSRCTRLGQLGRNRSQLR